MNVNTINSLILQNGTNAMPGLQLNNINNGGFQQLLTVLMNNKASRNKAAAGETIDNLNLRELLLGGNLENKVYLDKANFTDLIESAESGTFNHDYQEKKDDINYLENYLENYIALLSTANFIKPYSANNENKASDNIGNDYLGKVFELSKVFELGKVFEKVNEFRGSETEIFEKIPSEMPNIMKPSAGETPIPLQAERLKALINSHRDSFKNEIDFNKVMVNTSKVPLPDKIIKISDEAQEIKSQVITQVKDKIQFMVDHVQRDTGTKYVTMELYPQKLGKVEIKMTYENNKLSVEIKSLNDETKKILSSNVSELTKILSKTTEAEVNVVVKNYEPHFTQQPLYYTDNQNDGHGRQRNHYYQQNNDDNSKDKSEDIDFSELINTRNLKLNQLGG